MKKTIKLVKPTSSNGLTVAAVVFVADSIASVCFC
jgi:hypothetical protein